MNAFWKKLVSMVTAALVGVPLLTVGLWLPEGEGLSHALEGEAAGAEAVEASREGYAPPVPETPIPDIAPLEPSWDIHRGELRFILVEP